MSDGAALVEGLADQYRWARDLAPPDLPAAGSALVCGMGGSGISGDFAAAAEPGALIAVHKGYSLPAWAPRHGPLVVAVSYSGNTEETRSAVAEALEHRLPVVVVASGGALAELAERRGLPLIEVPTGLQPRAALGYLSGAVLRILEGAGLAGSQVAALGEAAEVIDGLLGSGGAGPGPALADDLAEALVGRIPLIYGAEGITKPVAQRWKTQINENSKRPSFWSALPELDHNEIVGWGTLEALTRRWLGIVLLRDRNEPAPVQRRFQLTTELIAERVPVVGEAWSTGTSPLARMAGLVVIGDLVSVRLAEQEGVDPVPVEIIEQLKEMLG